jgi:hypothetical protein
VDTVVHTPADTTVYTFALPLFTGDNTRDSTVYNEAADYFNNLVTVADLDNGKSRLQVKYDRRKQTFTTVTITKPTAIPVKIAETAQSATTITRSTAAVSDTQSVNTMRKTDGGQGHMARINWILLSLGVLLMAGFLITRKHRP